MTWSIPLRLEPDGTFPAGRPDPVADTARLILGIAPGERRMLPEFGWAAHRFTDIDDPVRRHAAEALAEEALRTWAGDLGIERVEILSRRGRTVQVALRRRGATTRIDVALRELAP